MYLPLDLRANIRIIQLFDVTDITASVMSSSKHSRHDIIIRRDNKAASDIELVVYSSEKR
jgi:hypothetical protein